MSTLSEIENKIRALKARYVELDAKLIPLKNGIPDGSVSAAMGTITTELARLEKLRERALVGDLVGAEEPRQQKQSPSSPPRVAPLPMPVFATKNESLTNPLTDLARLPQSEEERKQIYQKLAAWSLEEINAGLERSQKAARQDIPVAFTQGLFKSLIVTIGMLAAEMRMLVALGREKRQKLEDQSLTNLDWFNDVFRRLQALETRQGTPFTYEGVFDPDKAYSRGHFLTYEGSLWHCNCPSKGVVPGKGPNFQLAVKRGRDAKGI